MGATSADPHLGMTLNTFLTKHSQELGSTPGDGNCIFYAIDATLGRIPPPVGEMADEVAYLTAREARTLLVHIYRSDARLQLHQPFMYDDHERGWGYLEVDADG